MVVAPLRKGISAGKWNTIVISQKVRRFEEGRVLDACNLRLVDWLCPFCVKYIVLTLLMIIFHFILLRKEKRENSEAEKGLLESSATVDVSAAVPSGEKL